MCTHTYTAHTHHTHTHHTPHTHTHTYLVLLVLSPISCCNEGEDNTTKNVLDNNCLQVAALMTVPLPNSHLYIEKTYILCVPTYIRINVATT